MRRSTIERAQKKSTPCPPARRGEKRESLSATQCKTLQPQIHAVPAGTARREERELVGRTGATLMSAIHLPMHRGTKRRIVGHIVSWPQIHAAPAGAARREERELVGHAVQDVAASNPRRARRHGAERRERACHRRLAVNPIRRLSAALR